MAEVFGIDVSHHNGNINWGKVAASGKKFAIMKAQYEAKSHRIDETFEYNYKEAGRVGIARGVYIYIATESIKDPVSDAKALIAKLSGRKLEYGIWLDLEDKSLRKLSKAEITKLIYVYSNLFRAAGYYVGIYCNKDWYDNVLDTITLLVDFDFWIARYPKTDTGVYNKASSLSPKKYAACWQYSSKGTVPGITGKVDLDVDFDGVVNLMTNDICKKSNREIAMEVLDGKWGTSKTTPTRKELLTQAGYSYDDIQKIVNQLLKG